MVDPVAAMGLVRQGGIDAVVVDLLLPGNAGMGLLRTLLESSPSTLRIGLTTGSERQTVQQAGAPVHQLLAKPCDPTVLKAILARAFAARELSGHDALQALVDKVTSLPVLPQIYIAVTDELKSEDPSLERVGEIVAKDMALTAKILQLANSAFFGLGRRITHPAEAAIFLGVETLKAMVLSLQVFAQFQHLKLTRFNVENLWTHSWATGVLARRLCEYEELSRTITDESFIAGLLHDVGKLVVASNFPQGMDDTMAQAEQNKLALWEQECRTWGVSHDEVGGYLLGRWGLPKGVVEAVAFHHRPALARNQSFSALTAVHVANTLGKLHPSTSGIPCQTVDLDYLRSLELAGRVDGWREMFLEASRKK